MLHAGVVEMLVKEHFQLAVGRIAAGAGIVRKPAKVCQEVKAENLNKNNCCRVQ